MLYRLILTYTSLLILASLAHAQTPATLPFAVSKETTAITSPLHPDGTPDYVQAMNALYSQGVTPANNGFVIWLHDVVGTDINVMSTQTLDRVLAMSGATPPAPNTPLFLQSFQYLQTVEKMPRGRASNEGSRRDTELQSCIETLWTADEHPHTAAYLQAMAIPLDHATEAAAREKWWSPYVSAGKNNLWGVLLPSLSQERSVAYALAARATLRAKAGDFDGFLHDTLAIRRLARHVAGATLIEHLVAAAIETAGCNAIGTVAGSGSLTTAQCQKLQTTMDALPPMPPITDCINTMERWSQLEQLQQDALGNDDLMKETDLLPLLQSVDRTAVDWNIVLRDANTRMDEELAILRMPNLPDRQAAIKAGDKAREDRAALAATKPAPTPEPAPGESDEAFARRLQNQQHLKILEPHAPGETRDTYSHRVFDALGGTLWPSLAKADQLLANANFRGQALHVLLAAATCKAATTKWPEKLADLVPAYLKEIPHDPYDPATEIHLLAGDKGLRIYSYGPNNIDDGGIDNSKLHADDIGSGVTDNAMP